MEQAFPPPESCKSLPLEKILPEGWQEEVEKRGGGLTLNLQVLPRLEPTCTIASLSLGLWTGMFTGLVVAGCLAARVSEAGMERELLGLAAG